jgi:arylsulfatase A-like enzyme
MRILLALIASLTTCLQAAPPNIIFIIADDLGWADVAFHGGNAPTPHLDKLAAEGLELTHHYVAPVCTPTRAGLMTGRYWSRFGITSPQSERGLPIDTVTLPRALKQIGYDTCLTGKWHLGSKPEWGPNHYGFDHAYGSLEQAFAPVLAESLIVGFTSDWLFPPEQNRQIAQALLRAGKRTSYAELSTDLGHDSFLLPVPEYHRTVAAFVARQQAGGAP